MNHIHVYSSRQRLASHASARVSCPQPHHMACVGMWRCGDHGQGVSPSDRGVIAVWGERGGGEGWGRGVGERGRGERGRGERGRGVEGYTGCELRHRRRGYGLPDEQARGGWRMG